MATTTVKSTYALDVETVRALEQMAQRWNVSKSEALRRAIRAAAGGARAEPNNQLEALDRLQRALALTPTRTKKWLRGSRIERRAWSRRSESRGE
jgi:hypothetical protein